MISLRFQYQFLKFNETKIQKILSVDIVDKLKRQYNSRKIEIQYLKKHLNER